MPARAGTVTGSSCQRVATASMAFFRAGRVQKGSRRSTYLRTLN